MFLNDIDFLEMDDLLNSTVSNTSENYNTNQIDRFKIDNGTIAITYVNGIKFKTLYSEEVKKRILESMENNIGQEKI